MSFGGIVYWAWRCLAGSHWTLRWLAGPGWALRGRARPGRAARPSVVRGPSCHTPASAPAMAVHLLPPEGPSQAGPGQAGPSRAEPRQPERPDRVDGCLRTRFPASPSSSPPPLHSPSPRPGPAEAGQPRPQPRQPAVPLCDPLPSHGISTKGCQVVDVIFFFFTRNFFCVYSF